jgi:hypothetical protein
MLFSDIPQFTKTPNFYVNVSGFDLGDSLEPPEDYEEYSEEEDKETDD